MITENLSTLTIHKLTQAQYDRELEANNIDENALYLTPYEEVDLTPYITSEEIETVYETKADSEAKLESAKRYTNAAIDGHTHDMPEHTHDISDINNLQNQLNSKALSSHGHTVSQISDLTVTATELNYVYGVTSNIQTQLNNKANANSMSCTQTLTSGVPIGTVTVNNIDTTLYAPTIAREFDSGNISASYYMHEGTDSKFYIVTYRSNTTATSVAYTLTIDYRAIRAGVTTFGLTTNGYMTVAISDGKVTFSMSSTDLEILHICGYY